MRLCRFVKKNSKHKSFAEKEDGQKKSRKRRSANSVSDEGSKDGDEAGGKRIKMRGKKSLDPLVKKNVEEERDRRGSSSEDEKKEGDKNEEDKTPKKMGRPKKGEERRVRQCKC